MKINDFFEFCIKKYRTIFIYFIYLLNIRSNCEEPIKNPETIYCCSGYDEIPRKIWLYWHDEHPPLIVSICVKNIQKINKDFEVFFLNSENINDYININFELLKAESITAQSDLIRLKLLEKYGGFWMDASIMLFEPLDYYISLLKEKKSNFIGFYTENYIIDKSNPIVETWFLGASKNNKLIQDWLNEVECAFKIGINKYIDEVKKNHSEYIQKIPNPNYLFAYVASNISIRKNKNYYLFDSHQTAFFYHISGHLIPSFFRKSKLHYSNFLNNILLRKAPKNMPKIIKLINIDRKNIEILLRKGYFKDNSIMGEFIKFSDS